MIYLVSKYLPTEYIFITKGEKSKFTIEMPRGQHFYQVIKLHFIRHGIHPKCLIAHLVGHSISPLSCHVTWPGHKETPEKSRVKSMLQNNWAIIFKSVKAMNIKEILRDCSRLPETNETWRLNATRGSDLDCYKGHYWGPGEIWMDRQIRQQC